MNFFEHQELARRNSQRLVVLFVLAVIAIVVAVNVAATVLYHAAVVPTGMRWAGSQLPNGFYFTFLGGLAFAVAASANLPAIIMLLFWKKTTSKGIAASIVVGINLCIGHYSAVSQHLCRSLWPAGCAGTDPSGQSRYYLDTVKLHHPCSGFTIHPKGESIIAGQAVAKVLEEAGSAPGPASCIS